MNIDTHDDWDEDGIHAESTKASGGIYSLPVIGNAAAGVSQFYDEMAPKETDSTQVQVAKEIFRWSSVVTGAAAVAVIVL